MLIESWIKDPSLVFDKVAAELIEYCDKEGLQFVSKDPMVVEFVF